MESACEIASNFMAIIMSLCAKKEEQKQGRIRIHLCSCVEAPRLMCAAVIYNPGRVHLPPL